MAGVLVANNAWGTLNTEITQFASEIYLAPGQGDRFPNAVQGVTWFYGTLVDADNNIEIVRVVNRNAETLSVERGVDGTQARAFPAEARFELRPCAAVFNDKVSQSDFNSEVADLRSDFAAADSALESNLTTVINQVKEDYVTKVSLESQLKDITDDAAENYLTEEDITDKWLPLEGGEVTGTIRVEPEEGGGVIIAGGNLTVNKGSNSSGTTIGGDINAAGGIYGQYLQATSDIRMKDNVKFVGKGWGLNIASRITPITFSWKNTGEESVGVIAQEVEGVLPQAVRKSGDTLSVNYGSLTTVCLAAIQDLLREKKELELKVLGLQRDIEEMKQCPKEC